MKRFLLFWTIIAIALAVSAQERTNNNTSDLAQRETHVTTTEALNVGYTFMRTSGGTRSGNLRKQDLQLIYTGQAIDSITQSITDCYYVFALQPKGFVIVSADERMEPILGYSYDNNFVVENMPEHVRGWLGNYEQQIIMVIDHNISPTSETATKWSRLRTGQTMSTRSGESVGPLLTTTWDQGQYYNSLCPEDANGIAGHVPTGCVATAMAQIINYWQNPQNGRGTHSYYSNYGTLTVNYDSVNYDYANMPDALSSTSSPEEVNAVAELMRDCGVAVNMGYFYTESSSYDVEARTALINFFRFSPNMSYAQKSHFSNAQWHNLLQENLSANHPVLYSGTGNNGGHSFVCDGYNADNYYHFNFGWSGYADGWYLTTAINPSNYEYNSDQTAILGIVPDSTGNIILGQMMGTSTFTVEEPMEFYHLLGHNAFTGTDYSNSCNNTVIFVSADTTKPLLVETLSFENQNVTVYDSIFGSYLATLSSNSSSDPVFSTSSALTLVYQGSMKYTGFQLSVSQDNGCRMVSNVSSSVDTNTIHLSWHENGNATQWQVEYGLKGFSHGNGTIVTAEDTTIDISGLLSLKEYDIYVRSKCDINHNGNWSSVITVRTDGLYWHDVVLNQPEGYVEDSLGNVYISSAEGLVWLSKLTYLPSNQNSFFSGRKAILTADIDLAGYKWKAISKFYGTFDGQGHKIENMYTSDNYDSRNYLFNWIVDAVIKNIALTNCYSRGGLINHAFGNDTIMNCFVSGDIHSNGAVLSQSFGTTYIFNCASNCVITSTSGETGGIVGKGSTGDNEQLLFVRNCYSASSINSNNNWKGYILGYAEYATVENCYGYLARNGEMEIAKGPRSTYHDNAWFDITDSGFYLVQPLLFDPDSSYYSNLTEALNAGVRKYNTPGLRLWINDTAGINEGLPLLGPEYTVTCPNIYGLTSQNIHGTNGTNGVRLSWTEAGDASTWEIKYRLHNSTDEVKYLTTNNPDTIWGLSEQNTYLFCIRPVCNSTNRGGWSEEIAHVVDLPYWKDIVTSQPDGYVIDNSGNITISTAEGLAWLISVVNGLNGETKHTLFDKRIVITQDIDLGQFRWTAINGFRGVFDGGGKNINNLYVNELTNYNGLFGEITYGTYQNITLNNANVKGRDFVGMLFGSINSSTINNCHVNGTVYGENSVGGIAGTCSNCGWVNACSSSGTVQASYDAVGGLFGMAENIRNCYSRCNVIGGRYSFGGLVGTTGFGHMENCYATGNVGGAYYKGGLTGSIGGSLKNCYAAGRVSAGGWVCMTMGGSGPEICGFRAGVITGLTSNNLLISNCYGLVDNNHPLYGISEDGTNPIVSNTVSFSSEDGDILLFDSVSVGDNYYTDLLNVLNAWVDTYDTTGVLWHWVADTANINGGFPILEEENLLYNTVTLTIADSTPWGSVCGGGPYCNHEDAVISATPDFGYHFVRWNDGNTENPRKVTLTQDTTFCAIFEINLYSIVGSANPQVNYSFNFENSSKDYQWTFLNNDNENQWCIATLDDTCRALFVSNDNGITNAYSGNTSTDVFAYTTMTLDAGQYFCEYDLRCVGWGNEGYVRIALLPISEQFFDTEWNNAISLATVSYQSEWEHFHQLVNLPTSGEYNFVVLWHNSSIGSTAFLPAAIDNIHFYNNNPDGDLHGYVLGSDTVPYLDTVVLTAIPDEGFQFSRWNDGNTDNPRVVVADADKHYTALFECIPVFGSDSIEGFDWYFWNGSAYTVSTTIIDTMTSYLGCDSIVSHHLTIYEMVTRTVTLYVADSTPHGNVQGGNSYSGYKDIIATISATPDYGYRFVQWNDGITDNPRTVILTQDTSFTAIFAKDLFSVVGTTETYVNYDDDFEDNALDSHWTLLNKDYRNSWHIAMLDDTNRALFISYYSNLSNSYYAWSTSSVYAYKTIHLPVGEYSYNYDWRGSFAYWHFMRVALIPDSVELRDEEWMSSTTIPSNAILLQNSPYNIKYLQGGSTVEWNTTNGMVQIEHGGDYKLLIQWYNDGSIHAGGSQAAAIDNIHFYNDIPTEEPHGYVLGSDTVPYLDTVLLTAVPYEGYRFLKWHDGNTENPRIVVADADKYYIALYEYARNVTVYVADSTPYGSVSGGGTYSNPETIPTATISAIPDSGCHFVQWNDGNTDNPRTVILTQDTSFTAIFAKDLFSVVGTSDMHVDNLFDFENSAYDRQWTLLNDNYSNRWYITTLEDTMRLLFVSSSYGVMNNYIRETRSNVFAYTTLHLPQGEYHYNYTWRSNSYYNNFLRVSLLPAIDELNEDEWSTYSILPENAISLHRNCYFLNSNSEWRNESDVISISESGDYNIIVQWFNEGYGYNHSNGNAAAAIDNIHFYNDIPTEEPHGYVLGSDTVPYLDTVLLTAVPYEGYRFLKWHDGNTENPRAVVASSDKYYIALFEEDCEPSVLADTSTICEDQLPYNWDGIVFSEGGIYSDTLVNASGCDSILTKVLIVNSSTVIIDDITACDSFTWIDGVTYTESTDEPIYTMTSMSGCDSVLSLHLTMYYSEYVDFFEAANESYIWDNVTYTETGDYTITYSNIHGCDSMVTLHLTVYHSDTTILNMSVCQSDLPIVWNDSVFTNADTKTTIFQASTGADSVVIMTLIVTPVSYTEISHSVCGNELPFIWENMECPAPGDYTKTLTNTMECDSIITLHLTVNYPTYEDTTVVACESFIWHGETYSTSGNYSYYTTNSMGCDSVIMMYLIVGHSDSTTFSVTACDFYTWNDSVYTLSGDYTQNFQTVHGCDSVVTLHLTINHSTTGDTMAVACESFDWYEHMGITQSCENLTHTFTNAMGCDSVVTLHLTINNPVHTAVTETSCESFTWNGTEYTVSGDYTCSHADANGCTQVDTLHLTINNPVHTAVTETACETFTWNGTEYTVSGDYTYSHADATGCTQVDTLHLTINNPVHTSVTETACESFTWNGTTFTVNGDYTYSHLDANGCTQVDTLHLTIFNNEITEFTIVTESPCYTWNNVEYCETGDYTQTLQTIHGCDSVVTLHLTITVGINDYDGFDFKVYPNPTNNVVNVECIMKNEEWDEVELHLCDAYGRLLDVVGANNHSPSRAAQIDLSHYANGVYFVKAVADGKTIAVRKVVKQ